MFFISQKLRFNLIIRKNINYSVNIRAEKTYASKLLE